MTENMYRVVFSGEIAEGKNQDQVTLDIAALTKIDILKAQRFFDGRKGIVKSNISQELAKEYVDAFAEIGAIAVSEPLPKPVAKPENSLQSAQSEVKPGQSKQLLIHDLIDRVSVGAVIALSFLVAMSILVASFISLGVISYDFG